MICENCRLQEATAEVTQEINGISKKMYLCHSCAMKLNPELSAGFGMMNKFFGGSPMGILTGLNGVFGSPTADVLVCPDCKTTSAEFLKSGFVGCPKCYEAFEPLIVQTVKKLQQSDRHIGKTPAGSFSDAEAQLRAELRDAYENDDYERMSELSAMLKRYTGGKEGA